MKIKIAVAAAIAVTAVFFTIMGWGMRDDSLKCEAIRLGHAEWVSDIDGRAEFKWKEIKPAGVSSLVAEPHKP
jgi:hypothetical protein